MKKSIYFLFSSGDLAQRVLPILQKTSAENCVVACRPGVDPEHPGGYTLVAIRDINNAENIQFLREVRDIEQAWTNEQVSAIKNQMIQQDPGIDFSNLTKTQIQSLVVESHLRPSQMSYSCVMTWDFTRLN